MLRWRVNAANHFYCNASQPGQTYFLNIRFTDPHTTGPDCQGLNCQTTIQQFIGHF